MIEAERPSTARVDTPADHLAEKLPLGPDDDDIVLHVDAKGLHVDVDIDGVTSVVFNQINA